MEAQGSQIVNLSYFTNLTASINGASSCAELQALVTQAFSSLAAQEAAIKAELAALQPILALLSPPTLGSIITWVTSFISLVLTPMIKPTITYAAQLTALAAQISALIAAISAAQAKFPSCSISIPPMPS